MSNPVQADAKDGPWTEKEAGKLRALECMLWAPSLGSNRSGKGSGRGQPSIAQRLMGAATSLALKKFHLEVADTSVRYMQSGQPGPVRAACAGAGGATAAGGSGVPIVPPRPAPSEEVRDAVLISIRTIRMDPVVVPTSAGEPGIQGWVVSDLLC